jgi:orotate phosphoribosyltransferase
VQKPYLRQRPPLPVIVFDRVVGLKEGSPSIAIQFARKVGKSVALFRGEGEFKKDRAGGRPADLFDGEVIAGETVLIVDDSTTGGRKAMQCLDALRSIGARAANFLVLFEPLGKGARELLQAREIELIAVVSLGEAEVSKLLQ